MRLGRDILQLLGFILIVAGIGLMLNSGTYLPMIQQYIPTATPEFILFISVVCLILGVYFVTRKHPVEL